MEDYINQNQIAASWAKAYKKSFLIKNNIKHLNKNTPCEDWVFSFQVLVKNPNFYITNKKFYYYRKRENSIMDQINKSKNNDFDTIKLIRSDINEYINRAEECKINLYKNEILILSKCIFLLILKHGYTRCEKELNISQDILKKILNFQKEKSSWKMKIAISFRFIFRPIFKILFK